MTKTARRYTGLRALILALAAALLLLLGSAPGAWAQPDPPDAGGTSAERGSRTDAPPKMIDSSRLLQKAEEEGSVKVIIGLEADFEPEGKLSQARAAQQRQDIDGARAGLRSDLQGTEFRTAREFETIPYVALELSPEALEAARHSPNVTMIREDEILSPHLDSSTGIVQAPDVWASGYQGSGQTVAVLDTGVDKSHPFLAGKVVEEACYSDEGDCPDGSTEQLGAGSAVDCDYSDACVHGTHVAGIAAGRGDDFSGVARNANIMAVQVFSEYTGADCPDDEPDPCARTQESDVLKGLERVYQLRNTYDFSSVNLSLGGGEFSSNCDAQKPDHKAKIDQLRSVGIATVISSGNDGNTNKLASPACVSSAVSVGSTTNYKDENLAFDSNVASFLALLAPGQLIVSSVPGGEYFALGGTSMAAPHVAGAWALLKEQKPSASVGSVLSALQSTGTGITDDRSGGTLTKPRINISDALAQLSPLANDDVYHAHVIRGTADSVNDTNVGATRQSFEPDHLPDSGSSVGEHSVWFRWEAPESGEVKLNTCFSGFDTALAVYTYGTYGPLTMQRVADDDNSCPSSQFSNDSGSTLTFDATEGTVYRVAVAGVSSTSEGTFTLKANYVAPANDAFASAQTVSGSSALTPGTNVGATRQSGEPDHLPSSGSALGEHSVWYNWTAPLSGKVTFNTCTNDFATALTAYSGSAVGNLSPVTGNTSSCTTTGRKVTFDATVGTTYRIAVAGSEDGEKGTFTLGLDMAPEVTSTKPADGATKVSRSANVSATFSEEMDASSINANTFKLVKQGAATPVSATVTYDAATKTANLDPSARLKRGALYQATVATLVEDQGGNPLAQNETWSFKVKRR